MPAAIPIAVALGTAGGGAAAGYFGGRGAERGARTQADAAARAAQLQTEAANRAADLAEQANRETLLFEREKEATRRKEYADLNALNLQKFNEDLERRRPYMDLGLGALAKMQKPLPQAGAAPGAPYKPLYSQTPPPPGSLGDLLAKKA